MVHADFPEDVRFDMLKFSGPGLWVNEQSPVCLPRARASASNGGEPVWFLLWALVIWQMAAWTFAAGGPGYADAAGDGHAFGPTNNTPLMRATVERHEALGSLETPTGSRCTEDGRKQFINGLEQYYYQRQNQTERYPEIHGKLGADYIAEQWSAPDDKRIDRLTQEAYSKGYLKPADFDGVARKMVATVVKGERVIGKGCAG